MAILLSRFLNRFILLYSIVNLRTNSDNKKKNIPKNYAILYICMCNVKTNIIFDGKTMFDLWGIPFFGKYSLVSKFKNKLLY